jgi:VCBS repeat-containing protein
MKKVLLLAIVAVAINFTASAQKDSTTVIDNKGTIKWVLSSSAAVITKADSTILYVTPKQLADSSFAKFANNGLTKNGQTLELGGVLNRVTTIETSASNFLQITGLQSGSNTSDSVMVVNPTTGQLKYISASSLFNALTFDNGLTKTGNLVELGGALTKATTIVTDATNNLKITGLQSGALATDSLVVSSSDGTLKRVTAESLLQSGNQFFTATGGQTLYSVSNMPVAASKVWVYRNGAKLIPVTDYTTSAGQVNLTAGIGSLVVAGDYIEVQWVK